MQVSVDYYSELYLFLCSGESGHKFNSLRPSYEKVSGNACVSRESYVGHEQVLQRILDGESEEQGLAWGGTAVTGELVCFI